MSAQTLRADLAARGVELVAADGKLRYTAPRGVLTDADRAAIRDHKPELLRLLAEPAAAATGGTSTTVELPPIPASLHRQAIAAGVTFEHHITATKRFWRVCFNGCSRELENAIDRALMGGAA